MTAHQQSRFHGIALLVIIGVLIFMPRMLAGELSNSRAWLSVVLMLVIFTVVAGHWVTGVWRGAFINDRNRLSLSQLQLILWTIIVLATFLTGAFTNLAIADPKPLNIEVPEALWMLMGISTVSLIGSPLLASRKKAQQASPEEEAKAMNEMADRGRDASALDTAGRLLSNAKITDARWSDIFEADEVSRAGRLDMSKIQMTFFTLIVALVYASALASKINGLDAEGFHDFPAISESMIALLGISHAGFLTSKAVPERENVKAAE